MPDPRGSASDGGDGLDLERSALGRALLRYLRGPEHPAKLRVVGALGRWAFPSEGVVAPVEPGVRLRLHPRDWIESVLLRTGRYEPLTLRLLAANLAPGDTVLLAGVHIGLHLVVAARAVGARGRVIGVEPQPVSLRRARFNLALNGLDAPNVSLVAAALGDATATTRMAWARPEHAAAASLLDDPTGGFEVRLLTARELLSRHGVERLRLFLLDVEGYELRALAGLAGGDLPDIIVVEIAPEHLARAGTNAHAVFETLAGFGYEVHDLHGGGAAADASADERNVVAVRRGTPEPVWV